MALPELSKFEEFLNSVTLEKPTNDLGWQCILVKPERETDAEAEGPIHLWVNDQPDFDLLAFVKRFSKEFEKTDHPINGDLLMVILAVFASFKAFPGTRVNLLNQLFQFVVPVDVTHFRIYSKMEEPGRFEWNGYKVGLLDWDKLQYKCNRAKLDFCNIYGSELRGCYTLESPIFRRIAVDWKGYIDLCVKERGMGMNDKNIKKFLDTFHELVTYYYDLLGHYYHKQMLKHLEESQDLLSVFDLRIINAQRFLIFEPKDRISVYQNFGADSKTTIVAADIFRLKVEFGPDSPVETVQQFEKQYGFDSSSKLEIHNIIRAMCRSIHEGKKAMDRGAYSEGLLNYVIALEILFSEKDSASDSVSSRTAVVVHLANNETFIKMRKEILGLYNFRSQYVHRGYVIKHVEAERAGRIARDVVSCLLRLQKRMDFVPEEFPHKWLKRLDWIRSSLEADLTIAEDIYVELGIGLAE